MRVQVCIIAQQDKQICVITHQHSVHHCGRLYSFLHNEQVSIPWSMMHFTFANL